MSIAQDEITAQIKAIKGEWQQTFINLDSTDDAPSGLTRSEFKEVAHVRAVSCHARRPRLRASAAGISSRAGAVCAVEAIEANKGKVFSAAARGASETAAAAGVQVAPVPLLPRARLREHLRVPDCRLVLLHH